MVDHEVEYQVDVFAQCADIGPDSVLGIDVAVIRDGEPIVRCEREEGEQMYLTNKAVEVSPQEGPEALQRCLTLVANGVCVGDEHDVSSAPCRSVIGTRGGTIESGRDATGQSLRRVRRVHTVQQLMQPGPLLGAECRVRYSHVESPAQSAIMPPE